MTQFDRYIDSTSFLRNLDEDWARAIDLIGPCQHDPKAAREPYEALIRAIAYQQLTPKAGDAIIGRLKALCPENPFPTPDEIIAAEFDDLRACGFSGTKIATIKAISESADPDRCPQTRERNHCIDWQSTMLPSVLASSKAAAC